MCIFVQDILVLIQLLITVHVHVVTNALFLLQRVVLGLTSRYRFYVNNTEVCQAQVNNKSLEQNEYLYHYTQAVINITLRQYTVYAVQQQRMFFHNYCTLEINQLFVTIHCKTRVNSVEGNNQVLCGNTWIMYTTVWFLSCIFLQVASNSTSFTIHKEYLLLTTLTHTVRCICRKTKVEGI